ELLDQSRAVCVREAGVRVIICMKSLRLMSHPPRIRTEVSYRFAQDPAHKIAVKQSLYAGFGSKADIRAATGHVRFTPKSGHVQRTSPCLLWAKSGHNLG